MKKILLRRKKTKLSNHVQLGMIKRDSEWPEVLLIGILTILKMQFPACARQMSHRLKRDVFLEKPQTET